MRVAVVATVLVLLAPASAGAAPRTLVPGDSLGGVRVGMTKAQVLGVWGERHGVCRECSRQTWYFNERPFEPYGTGVAFRRGRVAHAFTIWRPRGWRTSTGLPLGAQAGRIEALHGPLRERPCDGYDALVAPTAPAHSVFYVYRDRLWGFGLIRPGWNPCL